jgi:hypothetical protein
MANAHTNATFLFPEEFYLLGYNAAQSVERQTTIRRSISSPKRRSALNGLHGIISQKTEIFITTVVRSCFRRITTR